MTTQELTSLCLKLFGVHVLIQALMQFQGVSITVLAGLFDSAHQLNQHIRFFSFFDALKDPAFFNKNIHRDEISSLILLLPELMIGTPDHEKILDMMIERIDNIICLEDSVRGLPAVIFDRAAAAYIAVEHLINLGHQHIAFLAIEDQRKQGYRQALLEHSLPYDESLIHVLSAVEPARSAYQLEIPAAVRFTL